MNHPLPIRPAFIPAPPEPEIPAALLVSAEAGPSRLPVAASTTECVICALPPKYTCPGCTLRTCSLACSKSHKEKYGCTGKRDTTAFVPLKNVTEGVWADDYRYLEEGRRKIAEWGDALPKGAMSGLADQRGVERGRGRGRGRGAVRGGRGGGGGDGRVMGLGRELEKKGVRVEFMPDGMERRKKNQSSWNFKNETLTLTVQLVIHTSADGGQLEKRTVNHSRVIVSSTSANGPSATLESLLPDDMDLPKDDQIFAIPYHNPNHDTSSIASSKGETFFPVVNGKSAIIDTLKGTAFVEYPTVHVYLRNTWEGLCAMSRAVIMPLLDETDASSGYGYGGLGGKREPRERDDGWKRVKRDDTTSTAPVATTTAPSPLSQAIFPPAQASTLPRPVAVPVVRPVSLGLGLADYGSDDDEDEADDVLGDGGE